MINIVRDDFWLLVSEAFCQFSATALERDRFSPWMYCSTGELDLRR